MITPTILNRLQSLKSSWNGAQSREVQKLLDECDSILIADDLFPGQFTEDDDRSEMLFKREVLEIGAQHALISGNLDLFESYYSRLKVYYYDYARFIEQSPYMYEMIALHLMHLLTSKMAVEFLLELELIPQDVLNSNVYLQHVITNYECFSQGRYHKILVLKDTLPSKNFEPFSAKMIESLRLEVLYSLPYCYSQITAGLAAQLLFFDNFEQFKSFVADHGLRVQIPDEQIDFSRIVKPSDNMKLCADAVIQQLVGFSKHFEYGL